MSGHSKWAKIARDKGANDAKRGAVFTRLGNQLAVAARAGVDPAINSSLAMAIEKAKAANMPMSNIERAIKRVSDKGAAATKDFVYEGRGPGGVGIIIEVATDNANRTLPEVATALNKNGGKMAEAGSVLFQFDRVGIIEVKATGEEDLLTLLDCGAMDALEEDGSIRLITRLEDLHQVRSKVIEAGFEILAAEPSYEPKGGILIELNDEQSEKLEKILDAVGDQQDVLNVYHNGA